MFQSNVFFKDYSDDSRIRKRFRVTQVIIIQKSINLLLLAEGKGVTATSFGQRPSGGGIKIHRFRKIHRVPSGEEATATSFGNFTLIKKHIKINRKNAPNELSPVSKQTKEEE
jgi:hypothetical protein